MNVKVIFISVFSVIVIGLVFYLVMMNRSSEKIVTAVIPIGVAAVIGILLAIFAFGAEPPIEEVFQSVFMYAADTKMPANFPWILDSRRFIAARFAPAALFEQHPEFFKDQDDENGATLYHHLLQKLLIQWIGEIYRGSWQTEILRFESALGREFRFQPAESTSQEPSTILMADEIAKLLGNNKFAAINTGIPPQIALPPHAKLTIKPPTRDASIFEVGEILIRNQFCTVSIRTEQSGGFRSIGSYQRLAELSDQETQKLWTASYIVRFKAEFSRWLSGNPEMPKHKRWARQLIDAMKAQFDEQVIWQGIRDDYRFLKETEAGRP